MSGSWRRRLDAVRGGQPGEDPRIRCSSVDGRHTPARRADHQGCRGIAQPIRRYPVGCKHAEGARNFERARLVWDAISRCTMHRRLSSGATSGEAHGEHPTPPVVGDH
jgi:hypothetical protein